MFLSKIACSSGVRALSFFKTLRAVWARCPGCADVIRFIPDEAYTIPGSGRRDAVFFGDLGGVVPDRFFSVIMVRRR